MATPLTHVYHIIIVNVWPLLFHMCITWLMFGHSSYTCHHKDNSPLATRPTPLTHVYQQPLPHAYQSIVNCPACHVSCVLLHVYTSPAR